MTPTRSLGSGITSRSVAGTDPEEARSFFEAGCSGHGYRIAADGEDFAYRCSSVGDDDLRLRSTAIEGRMSGSFVLADAYVVSWVTAGGGALTVGADRLDAQLGRPFVIPRRRSCHVDAWNVRESSVLLRASFLEAEAAALTGAHPGRLRFTLQQPTAEAAAAWARAALAAARVLHDPDASRTAILAAKRRVAHALLQHFPYTVTHDVEDSQAIRASRISAGIAYLHARAHEDLTIEQVADAAGLSVRGVQEAFRRLLGTTPLEHLRRVRLDRARDDFEAAEHRGATVAEVAQRWRMTHLGRFARYYSDRFGEQPRDTIRAARTVEPLGADERATSTDEPAERVGPRASDIAAGLAKRFDSP